MINNILYEEVYCIKDNLCKQLNQKKTEKTCISYFIFEDHQRRDEDVV